MTDAIKSLVNFVHQNAELVSTESKEGIYAGHYNVVASPEANKGQFKALFNQATKSTGADTPDFSRIVSVGFLQKWLKSEQKNALKFMGLVEHFEMGEIKTPYYFCGQTNSYPSQAHVKDMLNQGYLGIQLNTPT